VSRTGRVTVTLASSSWLPRLKGHVIYDPELHHLRHQPFRLLFMTDPFAGSIEQSQDERNWQVVEAGIQGPQGTMTRHLTAPSGDHGFFRLRQGNW
jgi:hypothetical protein